MGPIIFSFSFFYEFCMDKMLTHWSIVTQTLICPDQLLLMKAKSDIYWCARDFEETEECEIKERKEEGAGEMREVSRTGTK